MIRDFLLCLCILAFAFCHTSSAQPLSLQDVISITLQNNYNIKLAQNAKEVSENNAKGLMGMGNAGFLPTLTLNAGFNESINATFQKRGDTGSERDLSGAVADRTTVGLQLNWVIFDGFKMYATKEKLEFTEEKNSFSLETTISNTLAQVMSAYYSVVLQQAIFTSFANSLSLSAERLSIANAKMSIGSASQLDVLRAKVDFNTDSATVMRQQTMVFNAKQSLLQLLSRSSEPAQTTTIEIKDTITLAPIAGIQALRETMLGRNPQLKELAVNQKIATVARRELYQGYFPSLTFTSTYNYANIQDQASIFSVNRSTGFSYGVTAQVPLFNGFNTDRQSQNAVIEERNTEFLYEDTKLRLSNQLIVAYQNYTTNKSLISLEEENLRVAQQTVHIAFEKFRLGGINAIELRETQQNFVRAETRLITSRFETKLAEIEILRLSGLLFHSNP